jgi:hypothetical protein
MIVTKKIEIKVNKHAVIGEQKEGGSARHATEICRFHFTYLDAKLLFVKTMETLQKLYMAHAVIALPIPSLYLVESPILTASLSLAADGTSDASSVSFGSSCPSPFLRSRGTTIVIN